MRRLPNRFLWTRPAIVAAVGVLMSGALGCAEERPPINRVQANALAKSFFVGDDLVSSADDPEFWAQGTVVDVGYGAAQDGLFTQTYAQPMSRIKWQITEDMLIGRLTYQRIEDSDGKGAGPAANDGQIAYMYPITSHFDIRRSYNPATGEELNVVEENVSDRPWYERSYFRVDWSRNMNTDAYDYDTLSMMGLFGGINYEPVNYWVNDPNDPDHPVFDVDNGYFDITNKAFATPQLIDLSKFGWGIDTFPACYLDPDFMNGTGPVANCNPVEITIRQAFRRVVDTDYVPQEWDGLRFQAYGSFYIERTGYARNYGMVDQKWHRFANRYNIWDRGHYYADPENMTGEVPCNTQENAKTLFGKDPNRDENDDGTADECESVTDLTGFGGSQCDVFKHKCTLPFRARTPKANVWYYTSGSNLEFYDGTEWATHEWDVALRSAVQTARYAECKRNAAVDGDDCSQYPVFTGQQIDNEDAIRLAREVDDCRDGIPGAQTGDCNALADSIGGARGYAAAVIEAAKMPQMLVLCHSPVQAGDPAECGERRLPAELSAAQCNDALKNHDQETVNRCNEALTARIGDLRYHQVNVLQAPQAPSSWGIYTDAEDPLTGEKVSAAINIWSHINDIWSQGVIDQIRYIKGELSTEDVTEAEYVNNWASASEAAKGGAVMPTLTKADISRRARAITGKDAPLPEPKAPEQGIDASPNVSVINKQAIAATKQLKYELQYVKADSKAVSYNAPYYLQRMQNARGSEIETSLLTPAMQEYAGMDGLAPTEGVLDRASPFRGLNPTVQRELKQLKQNALSDRGACMLEAPAPNSMTAIADILEEKFEPFNPDDPEDVQQARAERMRRYIAQRVQYAVIIHEMGHSVGLRHNFVSSSDAYSYRPQYWQLRTLDGSVANACTDAVADGSTCVGPRYYDPVTENERKGLIWMFMHDSVMEYAGENTQDLLGLGVYDFAAARMFYGGAVAVNADPSYNVGTARGRGLIEKMDNFGGILGLQPVIGDGNGGTVDIHYSQLQNEYELLLPGSCQAIDPQSVRPSTWNEERDGKFHPVVDGYIVSPDGANATRCRQQPVDYVQWDSLRMPEIGTESGTFYRGGPSIDRDGRTRLPYGFATDRWADLGNLSVYRHDNGADPYELFNFFIAQQEIGHVFDYYRRNRQTFSVRNATNRNLVRFNEKMRDGAKGLGLLVNIYRDFWADLGLDFDDAWQELGPVFFRENVLASSIAFDHFVRMASRPEAGDHYRPSVNGDKTLQLLPGEAQVLRSSLDTIGTPGATRVVIPNGATGFFGDVGWGGKLLENRLAEGKGEYDAEYTINAGSYYDKVWVPMLMSESADNFISDSRQDFLDPRYRAVSLADVFPDGYRRFLANVLTTDDTMKGPRLASAGGNPLKDSDDYPLQGMGWISWWPASGPEACFPIDGAIACAAYNVSGQNVTVVDLSDAPAETVVVDPQIGFEQWKFLVAMTLTYIPENQKVTWLNLMQIYEVGADNDPGFDNRVEFHHPSGKIYVARSYGKEVIFGKTVEKGIAARVLEHANELLVLAYETTPVIGSAGQIVGYKPVIDANGAPVVKVDPAVTSLTGGPACTAGNCTCSDNRACVRLEKYASLPDYMRDAMSWIMWGFPAKKGVYD